MISKLVPAEHGLSDLFYDCVGISSHIGALSESYKRQETGSKREAQQIAVLQVASVL